jgi:NADPH-dependent 2,4-dienoyl-CoA reductase/sulfur reductase-like enzyme
LVVGAGPAGMAAARMASLHGHSVVLCEQDANPGGALRWAGRPPGRSDFLELVEFFREELAHLPVDLRYGAALDQKLLDEVRPEVAILATGSLPEIPMLKGLYQTKMQLCTVTDVLSGEAQTGRRVMVWGGNQAGLVLADHLASKGCEVVLLHPHNHFGEEMSSNDRFYLRERLTRGKVKLFKEVVVETFLADGVRIHAAGTLHVLSEFDTLVLADRFAPMREAANLFKGREIQIHFIGDAKQPRHLMYAISEAEEIGRAL